MKKTIFVFVFSAVVVVVLIRLLSNNKSVSPAEKISPEAAISNAFATARPQVNAVIDANFASVSPSEKILPGAVQTIIPKAGKPNAPEVTSLAPQTILENARTAIRNYGQRFGGNPTGSNAEITRALTGENSAQANFINADAGLRVNGQGELIDAWGSPFFFHQLSGEQTEVRSAGPDKILWTDDDLVMH